MQSLFRLGCFCPEVTLVSETVRARTFEAVGIVGGLSCRRLSDLVAIGISLCSNPCRRLQSVNGMERLHDLQPLLNTSSSPGSAHQERTDFTAVVFL